MFERDVGDKFHGRGDREQVGGRADSRDFLSSAAPFEFLSQDRVFR